MPPAKNGQQKFPILKKTTGICPLGIITLCIWYKGDDGPVLPTCLRSPPSLPTLRCPRHACGQAGQAAQAAQAGQAGQAGWAGQAGPPHRRSGGQSGP